MASGWPPTSTGRTVRPRRRCSWRARPTTRKGAVAGGAGVAFDIIRAVQTGYAVVLQDVRAGFASEGEFVPHFQEPRDGPDAIASVAAQPWSRGIVGTF